MSESDGLNPENVNWDFDAPTNVLDFDQHEHEVDNEVDKYFEMDHEALQTSCDVDPNESLKFDINPNDITNESNKINMSFENQSPKIEPERVENQQVDDPSEDKTINDDQSEETIKTTECTKNNISLESRSPKAEPAELVENEQIEDPSQVENIEMVDTTEDRSEEIITTKETNAQERTIPKNVEILPVTNAMETKKPKSPVAKPQLSILPNIITPSRMVNWKRPKPIAQPLPRPRTRSQAKPFTRSRARSGAVKPVHTVSVPQPPQQKRRKMKHTDFSVHLTQTKTPEVLRRKRTTSVMANHKTRVEKELEEIKLAREKAKKVKEESLKSFKKAIEGNPVCRKVPVATATAPKEFHFQTDSRIKNHTMATRQEKIPSEIDFTKELRKHPPSPVKLKRTVVKPFNLSSNRKRKLPNDSNEERTEFIPMAKAVIDFQTSNCFKTRSSKPNLNLTGLTMAKTPKLQARKRHRPVTAISMKEIEEQEVESIKQYSFHAQPLNTKILKQPAALPHVEKKHITKPIGFQFETDKRLELLNRPDKPTEEKPTVFKANPIPISSKTRGCVSGVPIVEKKKPCEVKTFSFAERDEKMLAKKEEKIKEIIQKEKEAASSFRAQPILEHGQDLPCVEKKAPTQQVPFKLKVDQRGQKKAEEWSRHVESEMKEMKKKAEFKANSDYTKVLYGKAFVPQKENKVTEVEEFPLHTEHRQEVWEENRKKREHHQVTVSAILKEQEQNAKLQEEKDIKMMRKNATHKAHEIRKYKPIVKMEATMPLTKPCSPKFSKRFAK